MDIIVALNLISGSLKNSSVELGNSVYRPLLKELGNTLINTFAPIMLNTAMMVFYLVVMLRYSVMLTVIGLASLTINAVVSRYISKISYKIFKRYVSYA